MSAIPPFSESRYKGASFDQCWLTPYNKQLNTNSESMSRGAAIWNGEYLHADCGTDFYCLFADLSWIPPFPTPNGGIFHDKQSKFNHTQL